MNPQPGQKYVNTDDHHGSDIIVRHVMTASSGVVYVTYEYVDCYDNYLIGLVNTRALECFTKWWKLYVSDDVVYRYIMPKTNICSSTYRSFVSAKAYHDCSNNHSTPAVYLKINRTKDTVEVVSS